MYSTKHVICFGPIKGCKVDHNLTKVRCEEKAKICVFKNQNFYIVNIGCFGGSAGTQT